MDHGTFVQALFTARSAAHIAHLQTSSYAEHMALDSFYKDIVDLADRYAEASIGLAGPLKFSESQPAMELRPMTMLKNLRSTVAEARKACKDEALLNILAEIDELIYSTAYKVGRLS